MWRTVVGSWFSFLVQCFCLTFHDGFQLPGRLEDVLRTGCSSTGRHFYGSGSFWAASCPFGLGCTINAFCGVRLDMIKWTMAFQNVLSFYNLARTLNNPRTDSLVLSAWHAP